MTKQAPSRGAKVSSGRFGLLSSRALAVILLTFLVLPVVALMVASSPSELLEGAKHPLIGPALWLSVQSSLISLAIIVVTGTPLAWWLAKAPNRTRRIVSPLIELPIVIPPAVVGIALLDTFGRHGLLGGALDVLGVTIPFTTAAVVMAQVLVAAPFYVQSATASFRKVDPELVVVARTLGASRTRAFFAVAVPAALPGLISGAGLAWARAVGEFGATLLFAGSLSGRTQTMPLAIFDALQADVSAARAAAVILALLAVFVLVVLRLVPALIVRRRRDRVRRVIDAQRGG